MKLIAMFDVGEPGDESTSAILERVADEIMTYVEPINEDGVMLRVSNVQVGAVMDMPSFIESIKADLEAGASDELPS